MVIVTDLNSRSNAKSIIRNFIILHTSFRMVCCPPIALCIILVDIITLMRNFVYRIPLFYSPFLHSIIRSFMIQ